MSGPMITPETKVGDLLDAYAGAEEVLIAIAPKFKALKNPVLRRTVAKVATLEQAARVADMPVNQLVLSLREALGHEVGSLKEDGVGSMGDGVSPDWIATVPKREFDADAMLAKGETPVGKIIASLTEMDEGEPVLIRSSFQVAPLIDALRAKGHEVFSRKIGDDAWEAWVRKG